MLIIVNKATRCPFKLFIRDPGAWVGLMKRKKNAKNLVTLPL